MKIQENQSRRSNIRIDRLAESTSKNWKNTENKLQQMLYDCFGITEGVVLERVLSIEK